MTVVMTPTDWGRAVYAIDGRVFGVWADGRPGLSEAGPLGTHAAALACSAPHLVSQADTAGGFVAP